MTATGPAEPADEDRDADEGRNAVENRDADVDEEEVDDAHLRDVESGAGCTEIWEHLSETRDE